MMKSLLLGFALSVSCVALLAPSSYAQVTDQTDKSEEDWRKSKKKTGNDDIFEAIKNTRGFGQGTYQTRTLGPMDSLPEESRRHIMKERAKVIAMTEPGTEPDTSYTPSEAAKTDPELAEQEKEAWTIIVTDMKGGSGSTRQSGPGGPNKVAVVGQGGQSGSQSSGQGSGQPQSGPMRGGSSQSVSDILAQIKGMKSAGQGQGSSTSGGSQPQMPTGQSQPGQNGQGQSGQSSGSGTGVSMPKVKLPTGRIPGVSEAKRASSILRGIKGLGGSTGERTQQGSEQNSKPSSSTNQQSDNGSGSQASEPSPSIADVNMPSSQSSDSQTQGQAPQAASPSQPSSAPNQSSAPQSSTPPQTDVELEPVSPLDYLKRREEAESESRSTGSQTSASDYLRPGSD